MGKEKKFTTEELFDIIQQFFNANQHLGQKMNFSNLAKFAQDELKIHGLEYYHFSRNKEVSAKVKEYNKRLKEDILQYQNDDHYFASIDIKEFIKANKDNTKRLEFFLLNMQDSFKNLYNRTTDISTELMAAKEEIQRLKEQNKDYKQKNVVLNKENVERRKEIQAYKEALNIKEEKQLINALNTTDLYVIESENEDAFKDIPKDTIKDLNENNGKDLEKLIDELDLWDEDE